MNIRQRFNIGIIIVVIFTMISTPCFANTIKDKEEYKINSIQELKSEMADLEVTKLSEADKRQLLNDTNPEVARTFVDEKMEILAEKMSSIEMVGEGVKLIDLGDNCQAVIYTIDEPEIGYASMFRNGTNLMSNTPGATTLWKPYGSRQFTSKFEVRTGILDVDLKLINHYTLSSRGVALRYGESVVDRVAGNLDLGSASAGSVSEVKKTAYTKGESIQISSTFTYRWAPVSDVGVITKQFKMKNYVKYSDIDTSAQEVKVVQSWTGTYL